MNEREPREPEVDEKTAQADVELTRKELGETLSALAEKADVKGRAQERMHRSAAQLAEAVGDVGCRIRERSSWIREHRRAVLVTALLTAVTSGVILWRLLRRGLRF